jgi:hypothetical protein
MDKGAVLVAVGLLGIAGLLTLRLLWTRQGTRGARSTVANKYSVWSIQERLEREQRDAEAQEAEEIARCTQPTQVIRLRVPPYVHRAPIDADFFQPPTQVESPDIVDGPTQRGWVIEDDTLPLCGDQQIRPLTPRPTYGPSPEWPTTDHDLPTRNPSKLIPLDGRIRHRTPSQRRPSEEPTGRHARRELASVG